MIGTHGTDDLYTLEVWLQIATNGICDEGCERIEREIREHYQDAYDSAVDNGLPPLSAHAEAMQSLGGPKAARTAFRKVYLTRWEANSIRSLQERHRDMQQHPVGTWVREVGATLALCLMLLPLYRYDPQTVIYGLAWILFALVGTVMRLQFSVTAWESHEFKLRYRQMSAFEAVYGSIFVCTMVALLAFTEVSLIVSLCVLYVGASMARDVLESIGVWSGRRKPQQP